MRSTLKTKSDLKCRYDTLAVQLISHGVNLPSCKTEKEVKDDIKFCVRLAEDFINIVTKVHDS